MDNFVIGMNALELGAGRKTKKDKIDPAAGIIFNPKIGDRVKKGDVIAELFTDKEDVVENVASQVYDALTFSIKKVNSTKLIKKIIK